MLSFRGSSKECICIYIVYNCYKEMDDGSDEKDGQENVEQQARRPATNKSNRIAVTSAQNTGKSMDKLNKI